MQIDFHDPANANTYASREASPDWFAHMRTLMHGRQPGTVADVGCGGGIYSRAWRELGAGLVIGLDFSSQMVEDAQAATRDVGIEFAIASAYETGLANNACDIVFSRAVVHHLADHHAAMAEAFRVTKPGGMVIVQDRTIEDVLQPATPQHFRAHFFERYPQLLESERQRRPATEAFQTILTEVGFRDVAAKSFWETRRTYRSPEELRYDLLARTGRSILHQLTDDELAALTDRIVGEVIGHFPLDEHDRWTMWTVIKPIDI